MTHPEWALKYKTKGTELRNIKGRYYLYRISSRYEKERKVTRKITHEMIGRITEEDGLIPRGTKKRRQIAVKEYGATKFLQEIGKEIIEELSKKFPKQYKQITALTMHRLLYQAPLKNNEFLYEESYLTETLGEVKLDKNTLTEIMQELGNSREKMVSFMRKFVEGKQNIIFDTTHVLTGSSQMKMNEVGYNPEQDYSPQVNLFYMFSVDKEEPIYYRNFAGDVSGIKALKLSIKESGARNCTVIGDKGFASEENFRELEKEGLSYIFPLKRSSKVIKYERLKSREYKKAFDGHFLYKDRPIFYYQQKEENGRQVTVFYDPKLKVEEESNYLRRLSQKVEGYSIEKYQEKQLYFGTMSIISNIKGAKGEDIYIQYKQRAEIETLFDSYKNLLEADRTYMHSDAGLEAWTFINHIATMLYYKIFRLLKEKKKLSSICPKDLLLKLTRVFKIKIKDKWVSAEINSKNLKLFSSLDISVT